MNPCVVSEVIKSCLLCFLKTFDGHDDIITAGLIFHIRKQPKLIALILTQGQHIHSELKQIASLWLFNSWTFWISFSISFLYYKKTHSQGGKNCCNPQVKILDVEHEMDRTKASTLILMQFPSCYKMTAGTKISSYQRTCSKEDTAQMGVVSSSVEHRLDISLQMGVKFL